MGEIGLSSKRWLVPRGCLGQSTIGMEGLDMDIARQVSTVLLVGAFAALLTSCGGSSDAALTAATPEPSPTAAPASTPSDQLPEGTYRTAELTVEQLVATGVSAGFDQAAVQDFVLLRDGVKGSAVFTLKLEAGRWSQFAAYDGDPAEMGWSGTYQVIDTDTVVATDPCGPITYDYALDADQLTLDMVSDECQGFAGDSGEEDLIAQTVIFETAPFTKIE